MMAGVSRQPSGCAVATHQKQARLSTSMIIFVFIIAVLIEIPIGGFCSIPRWKHDPSKLRLTQFPQFNKQAPTQEVEPIQVVEEGTVVVEKEEEGGPFKRTLEPDWEPLPYDYEGDVLAIGRGRYVFFVNPADGFELQPRWKFDNPLIQVRAVTSDDLNRIFYLLVWKPNFGVEVCSLSLNYTIDCLYWGNATHGNYDRAAIAYNADINGVYIVRDGFEDDLVFDYVVYRVKTFAYSEGGAVDVTMYSDAEGFRYLAFITSGGHIIIHDFSTGEQDDYYWQSPPSLYRPTCQFYQPLLGGFVQAGNNATWILRPGNDTAQGWTFPHDTPTRVIGFANAADPQTTTLWLALESGLVVQYNFTVGGSAYSGNYIENANSSAIAYMQRAVIDIQPEKPKGSSSVPEFLGTPDFVFSGKADDNTETMNLVYGDVIVPAGNLTWPTTWLKDQAKLEDGYGTTFGDLLVSAHKSGRSSYSYIWSALLTNRTTVSITSLYNPNSDLDVESSLGLSYPLDSKLVKFSVSFLSENAGLILFNNDPSATLEWSVCLLNDEELGHFNTNYTTKVGDDVTSYKFARAHHGPLRVNVPLYAEVDGVITAVEHVVDPPPGRYIVNGTEVLVVCLRWKFPYFNSTLFYDPDLGVTTSGGDGSDNNSEIVAIAVPVVLGTAFAICCVVIVAGIIVGAVVTYRRRSSVLNRSSEVDL